MKYDAQNGKDGNYSHIYPPQDLRQSIPTVSAVHKSVECDFDLIHNIVRDCIAAIGARQSL